MKSLATSDRLYQALKTNGYVLPENTMSVKLIMTVDDVLALEVRIALTPDELVQVGNALAQMGEEQK